MSEAAAEGSGGTEPDHTPLLHPAEGIPDLSVTATQIEAAAALLARGHGPFAVDAERASGFRYSNRAYLIQIRRTGAGTVLIDPVSDGVDPLTALRPVAEVLSTDEWILHSADQDLPCLAEVGLRPPALYDTELAGRLAGFDRVNLATMVQLLLGFGLAKGHGAADWSKRPLPAEWLNYAALDVELLIELRAAISQILAEQGKTDWAAQEFEHLRIVGPGGQLRRPRGGNAGAERRGSIGCMTGEAWPRFANCGRRATASPSAATSRRAGCCRIPPSSTPPLADPKTIDDLVALPVFGGRNQRRSAAMWLAALEAARESRDLPDVAEPPNGPPPPARWSRRKPEAAARLEAARAGLAEVSQRVGVPTENLISPELVRRLCWDWEGGGRPGESPRSRRRVFARRPGAAVAARTGGSRTGRGGHTGAGEPVQNASASRDAR